MSSTIDTRVPRLRSLRRRSSRQANPLFIFPVWLLMSVAALSMLAPVVFILFTSLRTYSDYTSNRLSLPQEWTLENYYVAWTEGHFSDYTFNSVLVVVISTIGVVVISALAAYPLVFMPLRGRSLMMTSIIALMVLPASILVVPTFQVVLALKLQSTYPGLILVYIALNVPFGIFLLANTYRAIPTELLDAASIDGASTFQTLRLVVIPMAAPALRTLTVLTAMGLWNELLFALVIMQDTSMRTLPVGVALINSNPIQGGAANLTVLAAALSLTASVPFIIYLAFNRSLARGMTAGALR